MISSPRYLVAVGIGIVAMICINALLETWLYGLPFSAAFSVNELARKDETFPFHVGHLLWSGFFGGLYGVFIQVSHQTRQRRFLIGIRETLQGILLLPAITFVLDCLITATQMTYLLLEHAETPRRHINHLHWEDYLYGGILPGFWDWMLTAFYIALTLTLPFTIWIRRNRRKVEQRQY